jgi:hypothetical protein
MKLVTSYAEVKGFLPSPTVLAVFSQVPGINAYEPDKKVAITDCLNYCRFSDIVWLLGKRGVEVQIAVRAAKKCAESVSHLKTALSYAAADAVAAAVAAYAVAYAVAYATDADAYVTTAVADAYATAVADADAYATAAVAAYARGRQRAKNKQFLLEEILAHEVANP